jgi:alcohol dehydrogenase
MRTTVAAVFTGPGMPIEFRDIALPELRGAEVLVEVVACTLCGSDLHSLEGRRTVPVPTILGHEILGRVAEFGPDAPRCDAAGLPVKLGDRIAWSIVASCGDCFYCLRSLPQKCERQTKYGHEPLSPGRTLTGGLAGYCVLVRGTALYRVPEGLDDAAACPASCATATVGAALEAAGSRSRGLAGNRVLVMGTGMLGVTTVAWARSLGAECVIACDTSPGRLALAQTFGATCLSAPEDLVDAVTAETGGHGVDVALEMTGSPRAFETILPLVRLGGVLVLVGSVFPSRSVPIAPEQIVRRCLTLHGIHNYAPRHLRAALEFLTANPRLPFSTLVAGWWPLSELGQALAAFPSSRGLRIGIRPRQ